MNVNTRSVSPDYSTPMDFLTSFLLTDDASRRKMCAGLNPHDILVKLPHDLQSEHQVPSDILEWAATRCKEHNVLRAEARKHRDTVSMRTRETYRLMRYLVLQGESKDPSQDNVTHRTFCHAPGILEQIALDQNWQHEGPLLIRIVNQLPPERPMGPPRKPAPRILACLIDNGYLALMSKLGLNHKSSDAMDLCTRMFPKRIDLGAYGKRLGAPLLPDGFVPVNLTHFTTLHSYIPAVIYKDGVPTGLTGKWLINQEADGSGAYHPECPEMKALVQKYGPVPMQFSYIHLESGTFAKGILVPREDCFVLGKPSFWIDHAQVKGSQKDVHTQAHKDQQDLTLGGTAYLGFMQTWHKPSTMKGCFEWLECVENRPDTQEVVKEITEENFQRLFEGGIQELLSLAADEDRDVELTMKLLEKASNLGIQMNPLSLPSIQQRVRRLVSRKLWHLANGAGIEGPRYVIVMDAGVRKGHVVLRGHEPGTKLAAWRFPILADQALAPVIVQEPLDHHLLKGKVVQNTIYMNPEDAQKYRQGDDDGDILGTQADLRLVWLSEQRITNGIIAIESKGKKLEELSNSEEGWKNLLQDPMGPVGRLTLLRSRLLALGDVAGAVAASAAIQCAVDSAKRQMPWANLWQLSDYKNWRRGPQGAWHAFFEGNRNTMPPGQFQDWDAYIDNHCIPFYKKRVKDAGYEPFEIDTLGWRSNRLEGSKAIDLDNWQPSTDLQGEFHGGNLVHVAHDHTLKLWKELGMSLQGDPVDMEGLLQTLLHLQGIEIQVPEMTWEQYVATMRAPIKSFADGMARALKPIRDSEDSFLRGAKDLETESLTTKLELDLLEAYEHYGLEGMVQIWIQETRHYNQRIQESQNLDAEEVRRIPNHAFRLLFDGSPVLAALGISTYRCKFLNAKKIQKATKIAMKQPDPAGWLLDLIYTNTSHMGVTTDEQGKPLPMHECSTCKSSLLDSLVRADRRNRLHPEREFIGQLVTKINQTKERPGV